MEDLWRRFQEALKHYTEATEDRKVAFETLRAKDEKSSKEIEAQMKKIQKLRVSAGTPTLLQRARDSPQPAEWGLRSQPPCRSPAPPVCSVPPGLHLYAERQDPGAEPRE